MKAAGSPTMLLGIVPMPKTVYSILVPVGGLALFLLLASLIMISNPGDNSRKIEAFMSRNQSARLVPKENLAGYDNQDVNSGKFLPGSGRSDGSDQFPGSSPIASDTNIDLASRSDIDIRGDTDQATLALEPVHNSVVENNNEVPDMPKALTVAPAIDSGAGETAVNNSAVKFIPALSLSNQSRKVESANDTQKLDISKISSPPPLSDAANSSVTESVPALDLPIQTGKVESGLPPLSDAVNSSVTESIPALDLPIQTGKVESGSCDLYQGEWFYDPSGPLYTNNSCPVISQMQNCQGNGRPDKAYENWRWKPAQCDLPRFDAREFLELMRGKTLAFIGDSVARNQMESLICILWQVETPQNRGNRKRQRWYFKSASVSIVRIWSSWLVHHTPDAFQWASEGIDKIFLDIPDEGVMEDLTRFDVVVLSCGHWFAKRSAYILNNEIIGGQLWWPDQSRKRKIDSVEAFGISVETSLTAIATHPNYTGLTIVRSFSPDHYEGGAWNTGGSCTGKVEPATAGGVVKNDFTESMHAKQVAGFETALKRVTNKSKFRLMDITESFGLRHDGHPGPYRSTDPNKKTKRGPKGEPPPQDCLHWCMPGPVDTWNEFVFAIIRREFGKSLR